jgi:hypothetical protein
MKVSAFIGSKHGLIALALTAASSYLAYIYINAAPAGYCSAEKFYFSDQDFIRHAISLRNEDWKRRGGRDKFTYSGKDFDPKNPNCCRVIRTKTFSAFNRMFDEQEISVELNNETSVRSIEGANLNDRFFFDVCGHLQGRIEYDWQGI